MSKEIIEELKLNKLICIHFPGHPDEPCSICDVINKSVKHITAQDHQLKELTAEINELDKWRVDYSNQVRRKDEAIKEVYDAIEAKNLVLASNAHLKGMLDRVVERVNIIDEWNDIAIDSDGEYSTVQDNCKMLYAIEVGNKLEELKQIVEEVANNE